MAVTTDDVKLILDTGLSDAQITDCIASATMLVDEEIDATKLSATRLDKIIQYLSAHFCGLSEPLTKQESVKGVSELYDGRTGLSFDYTRYGQQAMIFDTTFTLARINREAKEGKVNVYLSWVGS